MYTNNTYDNSYDYQLPTPGFGSYVYGILPESQAILAGAFGVSMQQIKNIQNVELERFAQIVYNLETNAGLPRTNGSSVPIDRENAAEALSKVALGSDIYGTYNTSNFFGCMTGLPYPLVSIQQGIERLQTQTLTNIYSNLYLAVKWEQATATWDGSYFTYTNRGGGYGRETGAPIVTVGGNPATAIIGTDPNDLDTFGKIVSISYTGPAGAVVIAAPPGGGWPAMNTVVQSYIDQANAEIQNIANSTNNIKQVRTFNTNYNLIGTMLKIEQRARFTGRPPVPIPFYDALIPYPQTLYTFVDSIPFFAADTEPNGAAQSLENISDYCTTGGQSLIGMMRQERNQQRLNSVGLTLDNNIPVTPDPNLVKQKLINGTAPGAVEGITSADGQSYTAPAYSQNKTCENVKVEPTPIGYYDPNLQNIRIVEPDAIAPGTVAAITEPGSHCRVPVAGSLAPMGLGIPYIGVPGAPPNTVPTLGIRSLGLFPIVNVIPPNLDINYISSTVLPSSYDVDTAIDKVIECNCDCWVQ